MTTRLRNKLAVVREKVLEAYRNGATLRQIGEVHGVSPGTVRNVLKEMGESLRSRGRRKKSATADPRILPVEAPAEGSDEATKPAGYEGGPF
jgi:transposase